MQELTDILRDMRLSGGVFLEAEFTAPWCIVAQVDADDCEPFIPMPPYLIAYHYVLEGRFILDIESGPRLEAGPGQLVVLPRNDRHCLASAVGVTPVDASGLITPGTDGALASIRCGGGGERTRILCGFLGSADGCDPLLLSLPPVMSLRLERHGTGKWIEESMRFAMHELQGSGPGAGETLARLAELLFAQAVREYVQQLPLDGRGWLHGLRDPVVGKALALLHAELDRGWTLDDLARRSAVSRSVLTDRFARLIGLSPMEYHRRRRLDRAAQWLTRTTRSIASIAFDTGYGSEEAFSRSFKRAFGASPGSFRKGTQTQ